MRQKLPRRHFKPMIKQSYKSIHRQRNKSRIMRLEYQRYERMAKQPTMAETLRYIATKLIKAIKSIFSC